MLHSSPRSWLVFGLLALTLALILADCSSNAQNNQKPTATKTMPSSPIAQASDTPTIVGTPAATATPLLACNGQLTDVAVPAGAMPVGPVSSSGATINCAYLIHQDVATLEMYFKTQMGKNGWTFLAETPEGPNALVQTYFKAQSFATITLGQHNQDAHTTDVTITVEMSK